MTHHSNRTDAPHILGENNFYIDYKCWTKILAYAKAAHKKYKSEISGMMALTKLQNGNYLLSAPAILKQSVSGVTTTIDKSDLSHYYVKAFKRHGKDVRFVWWHSHGNMAAFMSPTDEKTIQEYASGDWSLSLVVNIFGDYELRIQVYNPLNFAVKTSLNILNDPIDKPAAPTIWKELENKVVQKSFAPSPVYKAPNTPTVTPSVEDAEKIRAELGNNFAPRLLAFVASSLADFNSNKIKYQQLKDILMDADAFASYFDYFVDCPSFADLEELLRREKNPASSLVFKIEDNWE